MAHLFDTVYFAKDGRMEMIYGMMDELSKTVVKYASARTVMAGFVTLNPGDVEKILRKCL